MDNNYKVYIHTNKTNNKKYIGITRQKVTDRWKSGQGYIYNIHFYRAIQKYGWDNFEHEVVLVNLIKEQAEMFEIEMIKYYNATDDRFGYNIQKGGNLGNEGVKASKETRRKISLNHADVSGKNNPMYGRRGKDNPNFGLKRSEEFKKKNE